MNIDRLDSTNSFGMPPDQYGAFSEVMENLTPSEQASVKQIASNVNSRVQAIAGAAPKAPFYTSTGAIVSTVVVLLGLATWAFWPSADSVQEIAEVEPISEVISPAETPSSEANVASTSPEQLPENNDAAFVAPVTPEDNAEDQEQNDAATAQANSTGEDNTASNPASNVDPNNTVITPDPKTNTGNNTNDDPADNPNPPLNRYESDEDPAPMYTLGSYSGTNEMLVVEAKVTAKRSLGEQMRFSDMAHFPGGQEGLEKWITSEVKASIMSNPRFKGQSALVMVTVNAKGKVTKVEIIGGDSGAIRAETFRIFSKMPYWEKGAKKGKIQATIALSFDEPY